MRTVALSLAALAILSLASPAAALDWSRIPDYDRPPIPKPEFVWDKTVQPALDEITTIRTTSVDLVAAAYDPFPRYASSTDGVTTLQTMSEIVCTDTARTATRPESACADAATPLTIVWADVSSCEDWRPLISLYFGDETDTAVRVCTCESGGNPLADNPISSASGLFQHLQSWWAGYWSFDPFDPESSIYFAKALRDLYGWDQWACY